MSQLREKTLIPSSLFQHKKYSAFGLERAAAMLLTCCLIAQTCGATAAAGKVQNNVGGAQSDQPPKIFCQFNTKEYSPGDIWYPPVAIRSSLSICIRCTCLNTGRLNCTQEVCPANCEDSSDPCCKTCAAGPNPTVTRERGSDILLPPQLAAVKQAVSKVSSEVTVVGGESVEDTDETSEDDNVSCLHQGRIYRDREVFTANVSGLPIAAIDQCMQCQCQTGMVLCSMKSCMAIKCSLADFTQPAASNSDSCCHRCAAWKTSVSGQSSLQTSGDSEVVTSRVVSNHVIKDAGQQARVTETRYGTGSPASSVGPKVMSMSALPLDSSVTFRDITAINSGQVIGRTTQKPANDCISSGIFYLHGSTWHPTIGPFGPMECVSCKCSHGQIDCGRLRCPARRELPCSKPVKVEGHCCPICTSPNDKTFEEGTALCVSAKQDITAFKSFGFGPNETEYIEFAFLRPRRLSSSASEAQVERHEWRLLGVEIHEFTTQYLTPSQFETLRNRQGFTLLGATNEKNVEKFTRREKKLEKRCTSRCNVRISSLERSLRLHKLISRSQCLSQERMVHTV